MRRALALGCLFFVLTAASGAATDPNVERNKAVARQLFEEIFGPRWRIDLIDRIHTPDFVAHGATRDANLEDDRQAVLGWRSFAPDMKLVVEHLVAEGDMVAVHWSGTATNTGEGNGFPATGRKVKLSAMTIFRFREGRIAEEWNAIDMYSFLEQLGLLPERAGR